MSDDPKTNQSLKSQFEEAGEEKQLSAAGELWYFIMENKAWWMIPIVLVLGAVGVLFFFASTGAAPFIYTLF